MCGFDSRLWYFKDGERHPFSLAKKVPLCIMYMSSSESRNYIYVGMTDLERRINYDNAGYNLPTGRQARQQELYLTDV